MFMRGRRSIIMQTVRRGIVTVIVSTSTIIVNIVIIVYIGIWTIISPIIINKQQHEFQTNNLEVHPSGKVLFEQIKEDTYRSEGDLDYNFTNYTFRKTLDLLTTTSPKG